MSLFNAYSNQACVEVTNWDKWIIEPEAIDGFGLIVRDYDGDKTYTFTLFIANKGRWIDWNGDLLVTYTFDYNTTYTLIQL
jgi:hypothetical protein